MGGDLMNLNDSKEVQIRVETIEFKSDIPKEVMEHHKQAIELYADKLRNFIKETEKK